MKCLSFTRAVSLPVFGLIENMSGYVCPCCGQITNVFSTGGGQEMARREDLTFLGSLPVDTQLVSVLDGSEAGCEDGDFGLLGRYSETPSSRLFERIAERVLQYLS
jgi:hypothetical protein